MRWIIPVVAIFLAGCEATPVEKAEEAYNESKRFGASAAQLSRAAENVAAEYDADGNAEARDQWQLYADIDCSTAKFVRP